MFSCELCMFGTSSKAKFLVHLATRKHKNAVTTCGDDLANYEISQVDEPLVDPADVIQDNEESDMDYMEGDVSVKVALYSIFWLAFMFNEGSSSTQTIHPVDPQNGMEIPYYMLQ